MKLSSIYPNTNRVSAKPIFCIIYVLKIFNLILWTNLVHLSSIVLLERIQINDLAECTQGRISNAVREGGGGGGGKSEPFRPFQFKVSGKITKELNIWKGRYSSFSSFFPSVFFFFLKLVLEIVWEVMPI